MKRLLKSLIFTAGLGIAQAGTLQISLEDILFLTKRGVSDETVLVFLKTREIGFIPNAEDIDKLLASGVSQEAIRYILRQTATYSTPSYSYRTTTYVDLYPPYYYTPYYSGTSVYLRYSSYPYPWFGNYYGGVHYASLHHRGVHHLGHNDHGVLSHSVHRGGHVGVHASRHGLGHNVATGIRHGGGRHRVAHGGRHNVGHSRRSPAHRGGHGGGRHRGGHSGGHGGGHGGGH